LFTAEDSNLIESQLLLPAKREDNLPEEKFNSIKVIAERPTTRPLFNSKYERYEWHLSNGCHSQEDRKWFESYIKSEEYRQIYGEAK